MAELSPDTSASVWAQFADGSELYVSAAPLGSFSSDVNIIESIIIDGVEIVKLTYDSTGIRVRFGCGQTTYELGGSPPPDFQGDLKSLAISLARDMKCHD